MRNLENPFSLTLNEKGAKIQERVIDLRQE